MPTCPAEFPNAYRPSHSYDYCCKNPINHAIGFGPDWCPENEEQTTCVETGEGTYDECLQLGYNNKYQHCGGVGSSDTGCTNYVEPAVVTQPASTATSFSRMTSGVGDDPNMDEAACQVYATSIKGEYDTANTVKNNQYGAAPRGCHGKNNINKSWETNPGEIGSETNLVYYNNTSTTNKACSKMWPCIHKN